MLAMDCETAPRHFLTVTTRDPDTSLQDFRDAFAAVAKRLKRRFGRFDYYGTIEETTGRYAADGRKRMHGHFITKGILGAVEPAERLCRETWERSTFNAMGEAGRAHRVTLSEIASQAAIGSYLGTYLSKPEQLWTAGRRIRSSVGFFPGGIVLARERALGALLGEAAAWREGLHEEWERAAYAEVGALNREGVLHVRRQRRAELAALREIMAHNATDDVEGRSVSAVQLLLDVGHH